MLFQTYIILWQENCKVHCTKSSVLWENKTLENWQSSCSRKGSSISNAVSIDFILSSTY